MTIGKMALSALTVFALNPGAALGDPQLTGPEWFVTESESSGSCTGSALRFTQQLANGSVEGYFDWVCLNGSAFARELLSGTLMPDGMLDLAGGALEPHPTLGGPQGILQGCTYAGLANEAGTQITTGTLLCPGGVSGTWSASRQFAVPAMSPIGLGVLLLALAIVGHRVTRSRS